MYKKQRGFYRKCLCMLGISLFAVAVMGCGKDSATEGKDNATSKTVKQEDTSDKEDSSKDEAASDGDKVEVYRDDEYDQIYSDEGDIYELDEDKMTASFVNFTLASEYVTIPSTVVCEGKEYTVDSIADEALSYQDVMEEIVLPDSLTTIGKEAFCGCTSLKKIVIPDSVVSLGSGTFYDCEVLKEITLGKGIVNLPDEIFTNCYELKTINWSESLVSIGREAFWSCENIKELTLPDTVVSIGESAFCGSGIKELTIPSVSVSLTETAFEDMYDLEVLYVQEALVDTAKNCVPYDYIKVKPIE